MPAQPIKSIYRATNDIFLNTDAVIIEYHDVLNAQWFSLFRIMAVEQLYPELFDLRMFRGLNTKELFEWYVNRRHQNFFLDLIPTNPILPDKYEDYKKFCDWALFDSSRIKQLYQIQYELNMSKILTKLLSVAKCTVRHFYIYQGEYDDEFLKMQCKENFPRANFDYLHGDFKEAIKRLSRDATYILSDVTKIRDIQDLGKLKCASILVANGYRYNYEEDDETKLKVDMEELNHAETFRCSFFDNLYMHIEGGENALLSPNF